MAEPTERELLKNKADLLGVEYKGNISTDKLRELVNAKVSEADKVEDNRESIEEVKRLSKEEKKNELVKNQRKDGMKLKRVIMTCNDPDMKDYTTTPPVSIANSNVQYPTIVVPLNVEWHLPAVYYNFLKEQEMKINVKGKDLKGRPITVRKTIKRYNIQDLPDLTVDELQDLKKMQIARDGVSK